MGTVRAIASCLGFISAVTSVGAEELSRPRTYESEVAALSAYLPIIDQIDLSDMRMAMRGIWEHGLNPLRYWSDQMEYLYQRGDSTNPQLKAMANENFLQLLKDISVGSVNPVWIGPEIKFAKKTFMTPEQLQLLVLSTGGSSSVMIERLAPQNMPYLSLKSALQKIYPLCSDGQWQEIEPAKIPFRLNSRHKTIAEIKKRLHLLGYKISVLDDLFDREMLRAISDIQWNQRINPDAEISPNGKVWSFLNVSCMDRVRQLQADMEKLRWFPQTFEEKYILVNLAMSYFMLLDPTPGQGGSMTFRTINGRPARKTPTMRDEIVKVIFNPYWVVPPTIFLHDKVEDLKGLTPEEITLYFNKYHYEVWDKVFRVPIDPATVDWKGISEGTTPPDIYIRQKPHLGNALGVLKFELTNSFAIYLHDTNQRELFKEPQRHLSSGCVRLEKPFDLAEYLLQGTPWDRTAIETIVARPGEIVPKPTEVSLGKDKTVPVYIIYLTSQMSSDGIVRFVEDQYGQNEVIGRFISGAF